MKASVSQLSVKDVKSLWVLIEIHGGKLKPTLDSTCTHLICGKGCGVRKFIHNFVSFK